MLSHALPLANVGWLVMFLNASIGYGRGADGARAETSSRAKSLVLLLLLPLLALTLVLTAAEAPLPPPGRTCWYASHAGSNSAGETSVP